MQANQFDYQQLFQRYLRDDLNEKEIHELLDFIAAHPGDLKYLLSADESRSLLEKLNIETTLPETISNRMHGRLISEINNKRTVAEDIPVLEMSKKVHPFRIRLWWAAACVIALLGTGVYMVLNNVEAPPAMATTYVAPVDQSDILPGSNGAILTLSDGTQVVLDSLGNGVIALQGKTEVRLKDGSLLYDRSDDRHQSKEISFNSMTTPRGRQYQLVLSDGTHVWLNAGSSLRYPTMFAGGERKVEITGEAYFEVAHDPAMPFKVSINNTTEVIVLGTHFNINAYSDEASINTTLLKGSVKIKANQQTKMLIPGQQAQVNQDAGSIRLIKTVDLAEVMAWKNGAFSFTNADLPTVMRQLERWYDVEVEYAGAIPQAKFSGEIGRSLSLSQVLKLLGHTRISYKIEGGSKIIILPDE